MEDTSASARKDSPSPPSGSETASLPPPDSLLEELSREAAFPISPPTVPVGLPPDLRQRRLFDSGRIRASIRAQDAVIESDRAVSGDLIALYKALGGGWADAY